MDNAGEARDAEHPLRGVPAQAQLRHRPEDPAKEWDGLPSANLWQLDHAQLTKLLACVPDRGRVVGYGVGRQFPCGGVRIGDALCFAGHWTMAMDRRPSDGPLVGLVVGTTRKAIAAAVVDGWWERGTIGLFTEHGRRWGGFDTTRGVRTWIADDDHIINYLADWLIERPVHLETSLVCGRQVFDALWDIVDPDHRTDVELGLGRPLHLDIGYGVCYPPDQSGHGDQYPPDEISASGGWFTSGARTYFVPLLNPDELELYRSLRTADLAPDAAQLAVRLLDAAEQHHA